VAAGAGNMGYDTDNVQQRPGPVVVEVDLASNSNLNLERRSFDTGGNGGNGHVLAVLVAVAGLQNFPSHLERIEKGILGAVKVEKVDVTKGEWYHHVGLVGERLHYFNNSKSYNHPWRLSFPSGLTSPQEQSNVLTWHRLTFPKQPLLAMLHAAIATQVLAAQYLFDSDDSTATDHLIPGLEPITAFVLHLGTMRRGLAYVNGRAIGRHWNIKASCTSTKCTYPNGASGGGETCPVGCGYASQSWYNVPAAWITDVPGDEVDVVVFDEGDGDPRGISFGVVAG